MSTVSQSVTATWTVVTGITGAKKWNVSNVGGNTLEYAVAASAPSGSTFGVELTPSRIHPVDTLTGQSLFVRSVNGSAYLSRVAVDEAS